jgi:hypothetical protein
LVDLPMVDLAHDPEPSDEGVFLDRQPLWFKLAGAAAALYGAYLIGWSNAEPAHQTATLQQPTREIAALTPALLLTDFATVVVPGPLPPLIPIEPSTPGRALDNDGIREVQARLAGLGYDPGPIDGVHGPQTVSAVKRFEIDGGREPTGNIDQYLLERLRR